MGKKKKKKKCQSFHFFLLVCLSFIPGAKGGGAYEEASVTLICIASWTGGGAEPIHLAKR